VSFEVVADAYGRFMGRFSEQLAGEFLDFSGLAAGSRGLDVGCGTGALTARLAERFGAAAVSAVDPSSSFVEAARERLPGVDVRRGSAEQLPFADDTFGGALGQLVVHFMSDPVAGLREMARVTVPGGVVAACVWDHAGGRSPLSIFWRAALDLDPGARDESNMAGVREGHLAELFEAAGLRDITPVALTVRSTFADLDEWWEPYTLGVGPAGEYVKDLDQAGRDALKRQCSSYLPSSRPFVIEAAAWSVKARVA